MILLSAAIFTGTGNAESRSSSESALAVALNDSTSSTTESSSGRLYKPQVPYQGVFETDRIYKKRFTGDLWKSPKKPAKVFSVKCQEAAQSLSSIGTWTGNLNQDGSCGPTAEPAQWATGNYLNYQAAE